MQVVFHILESQPPEALVGNIAFFVKNNLPSEELKSLEYKFLKKEYEGNFLFRVDLMTSEIFINIVIDREDLCAFAIDCFVVFDISITSRISTYFEVVTVKVIIGDVNDNPPIFPDPEITLFIPENVLKGSSYPIAAAKDLDGGENNSIQSYELVSLAKMFALRVSRNLDGSFALEIVVHKSLDREEKNYYRFFIVAKDGGQPPLSGYVIVNVNITDENDNVPKFSEQIYDISVMENTPVYTSIAAVSATDLDIGANGKLSYRLRVNKRNKLADFFELNQNNGDISVLQDLRYQTGNEFEAIVEAHDQGTPAHFTQSTLRIRILDVGNDHPMVSLSVVIPTSGRIALLQESAQIGTPVAHVYYVDKDQGSDGIVQCQCDPNHFSAKRLQNGRYVIQVNTTLDRETTEHYLVSITCSDGGTPSLSISKGFEIRITDENDNKPSFTKEVYEQYVIENNDIPNKLLRVAAVDRDLNKNAVVHYFLNLMDDSVFKINRNTGDVSLLRSLDREELPEITFKVLAIDEGNPSLTGTADIVIKIIDQNDNSPIFEQESLTMYVNENVQDGTHIGKIEAHDADSFQNGKVQFTMVALNQTVPFVVYSNGLVVSRRSNFGRMDRSYSIPIIAKDGGIPTNTAKTYLNIQVVDTSDKFPALVYMNDKDASITIPFSTNPGSVIGRIISHDSVLDDSQLSYNINSVSPGNIFQIQPTSGEIILKHQPDAPIYNLSVSVKSNGISNLNIIIRVIKYSKSAVNRSGLKISLVTGSFVGICLLFISVTTVIMVCIKRPRNRRFARKGICIQEETRPHNSVAEISFIDDKVAKLCTDSESDGEGDFS
ncbi:hypothetical protein LOTGIDRAFT_105110 [Lottia gigantea]|uniref:Cadherin domain-containing protein n=1 Tax=Lottia gigantea TaxID=225164 RepID=V4AFR4_LOTGI|nr:hypothetical protein LOTGIDRAFT_105110 [Lottia gigantea]ESO93970.1 hypothetical protein LOTGIDRAFT_105110 [Lottia gigantea]